MPSAPEILKQLTKLDVRLLQLCFDYVDEELKKSLSQQQVLHIPRLKVDHAIEQWKGFLGREFGVWHSSGRHAQRLKANRD
jgi:hypothetical protein